MKKELCFVLALIMLCIATGTALAADELADAVCLEQGFSTKAPAGLNTVYEEENGLRISVGTPGKVPFVLISRRPLELKFKDPVNYLNNVYREYMENTYGDKMIGTNPCREYEVGGKKLLGARYMYKVQDYTLCLLRLIEVRDDGDVEYSAKYIDGKGEATLSVLETAIKYYEVQDKTNDHLLCITIDGADYRIGTSTLIDFVENGWTYEKENDGVFGLYSPENESWIYVKTLNGSPDDPLRSLDMMWADGVPMVYQGFSEDDEQTDGQAGQSLWDWLVDSLDARENEEGTLIAKVPLSSGNYVQIETKGVRVRLSIVP